MWGVFLCDLKMVIGFFDWISNVLLFFNVFNEFIIVW